MKICKDIHLLIAVKLLRVKINKKHLKFNHLVTEGEQLNQLNFLIPHF